MAEFDSGAAGRLIGGSGRETMPFELSEGETEILRVVGSNRPGGITSVSRMITVGGENNEPSEPASMPAMPASVPGPIDGGQTEVGVLEGRRSPNAAGGNRVARDRFISAVREQMAGG